MIEINGMNKELITESHDVSSFKELRGLDGTNYDPGTFITAGDDGWIKKWDLNKKEVIKKRKFEQKIKTIGWSPKGNFISVGDVEGTVNLLNDQLSTILAPIKHRKESITLMKFSPNNRYLAVGSLDGFIDIYDSQNDSGFFQRSLCCKVTNIF